MGARGAQAVPAVEGNGGRQVDAGIIEPFNESLKPRAAFGEGQFAQIVPVVAEQIIGAQVDREILDQLRRDHFAVEALLQHVEALHPTVAHH